MSLAKTTISGLFWTFSQQFSVQFINFIVQIILARILVPAEFGLLAMINVFVAIGTSLMDSGMTSSLIRTPNPDHEDYSTVFFVNLAVSLLIYFILFLCAPLITNFYKQPALTAIIRVYSLSFVITALVGVQTTRLTKAMKFKVQMSMQLPSVIVGGIVGISLAYAGFGVWSLVWMNLAESVLFTGQHWIFSGWYPSFMINKEKLNYHFKFGYKLTITGIINSIFDNAYNIIIGKFFSVYQVGLYNRAYTVQLFPVQNLGYALNKVTYPMFASIQDDAKLKAVYKKITQQVIFWVVPLIIFLGVLAKPLFIVVFTAKWLPSVPYFQILCVVSILYPLQLYNLNILRVKGRSDLVLKINILRRATFLVCIALTISYGITALLITQSVNAIFFFIYNSHYSGKFINYNTWHQIKDILPILLLGLLSGLIVKAGDYYIYSSFPYLAQLIVGLTTGLGVYLLCAWVFKFEAISEFKHILNLLRKKKLNSKS